MIFFFSIFFTLYAAINSYIFIRGWQALEGYPKLRILYTLLFVVLSLSYLVAKFLTKYFSSTLYDVLLWIGSFWFAFMVYFLLSIFIIDILRFFFVHSNIFSGISRQKYLLIKQSAGILVLLVVFIIILLGYLNTTDIKTKTLNLSISKGNGKLNHLNAVLVSDIHLSPMDDEKFLSHIVNKINELNPDIVLIAGDLFDDKAKILEERGIGEALNNINSKYGTFAITGNHEFINGIESATRFIEKHHIKLLRDSSIFIDDSFYILGRDDRSVAQFTGKSRAPLKDLTKNLDNNFPIIMMDHTPFGLEEAQKNNIALQLSGHTHHGQMFPANLITKMVYEVSWGYLEKDKTQYYVSCGVGTWGPRVRIGSNSEIINLKINFAK
jgi:predicted MPP superfamily phosphohydrolase